MVFNICMLTLNVVGIWSLFIFGELTCFGSYVLTLFTILEFWVYFYGQIRELVFGSRMWVRGADTKNLSSSFFGYIRGCISHNLR